MMSQVLSDRRVWSRLRAPAALVYPLSLAALASCAHHKVVAFAVEPTLICPGQAVEVTWTVQGRASLRADIGSTSGADELVPSQGERKVSLDLPATFTVKALDANPADGQSFASRSVEVPQAPVVKAANATCDAASGKCTGTFTLATTGAGVLVRTIARPSIVWGGHAQTGRICVAHVGLASTCVTGNDTAEVAVAAGGDWTLATDLPAGESGSPGPQLRVELGFGCP